MMWRNGGRCLALFMLFLLSVTKFEESVAAKTQKSDRIKSQRNDDLVLDILGGDDDSASNEVETEEEKIPKEKWQDGMDKDVIQCRFMDNFFAVCETGCANEPIVVNLTLLDQDRQEAVMLRKCDQTTAVNRTWNVEDGVLDSAVFPTATSSKRTELTAVCTFSSAHVIFECAGVAVCDSTRDGIDACSGGVPWRGNILAGQPLKLDTVLKGNITAYAQNSGSQSQPPDNSSSPDESSDDDQADRPAKIKASISGTKQGSKKTTNATRRSDQQPKAKRLKSGASGRTARPTVTAGDAPTTTSPPGDASVETGQENSTAASAGPETEEGPVSSQVSDKSEDSSTTARRNQRKFTTVHAISGSMKLTANGTKAAKNSSKRVIKLKSNLSTKATNAATSASVDFDSQVTGEAIGIQASSLEEVNRRLLKDTVSKGNITAAQNSGSQSQPPDNSNSPDESSDDDQADRPAKVKASISRTKQGSKKTTNATRRSDQQPKAKRLKSGASGRTARPTVTAGDAPTTTSPPGDASVETGQENSTAASADLETEGPVSSQMSDKSEDSSTTARKSQRRKVSQVQATGTSAARNSTKRGTKPKSKSPTKATNAAASASVDIDSQFARETIGLPASSLEELNRCLLKGRTCYGSNMTEWNCFKQTLKSPSNDIIVADERDEGIPMGTKVINKRTTELAITRAECLLIGKNYFCKGRSCGSISTGGEGCWPSEVFLDAQADRDCRIFEDYKFTCSMTSENKNWTCYGRKSAKDYKTNALTLQVHDDQFTEEAADKLKSTSSAKVTCDSFGSFFLCTFHTCTGETLSKETSMCKALYRWIKLQ